MRLLSSRFALGLFLLLTGLSAVPASAQRLVRVPQDARTLEAAISRVADGGVIEMAAGTYPSPPKGFLIGNERKGFTIRAAGGPVVLDGGGSRPILRFINFNRDRGRLVTFQGITFRNGASVAPNVSGGVTLDKAEAEFRNCVFEGNTANAPTTGGGAAKVFGGSTATFINCRWRGNWSKNRGGALVVRDSEVTLQGGSFTGNRTNLPGHNPGSAGGAVYVLDATLRVSGVRFEENQAGWTGGAIYGIGLWDGPGAKVEVTGSTFLANQAVGDPCCTHPEVSTGGAIHVENLTALTVHQSRFVLNRADSGGAIDGFRAFIDVHGSVFQGNQATAVRPDIGIGGAIAVFSVDGTGSGEVNRRSSRLTVTRSLLEGGTAVERAARSGGCLFVAGDLHRAYGDNGITPLGTLDENRAKVILRHVVFSDCDAEAKAAGPGFGGAMTGDLVDLTMEDSMVLYSDARGEGSGGGGLAIREESVARIYRTTFAGNSAGRWGGALFLTGSDVDLRDSRFFGNDVAPGVSEPISQSRGAAILTMPRTNPTRPRNVGGVVANSVFSDNLGLPIWEIEPAGGPVNDVRYDGNRFSSNGFGDLVYVHSPAAPNGLSATALNSLVIHRSGLGSTPKSTVPNTRITSPREGALVAVPAPESVGAEVTSPQGTFLAYAWSGRSAGLAGQALGARAGFLSVAPGDYTLAVDQSAVATARVTGSCTAGPYLCLNGNRFRAEVTWKANGASGSGQAEALTGDTGYFWFFDPANAELVVKVLDGRGLNGHFWVFYGALTNVEYTLRITDTATGNVKTYVNPPGRFASAGDTSAFPAPAGKEMEPAALELEELAAVSGALSSDKANCAAGPLALCLNGGRFRVELAWKDFAGKTGSGQAVPLTSDTGYFWFTSPSNVEVIIKVLDGRPLNGHFWVFYGALTNQEYTITVTDTETGVRKTYFNRLNRFGSVGDTSAIPGS
jgi:hypothetical protein